MKKFSLIIVLIFCVAVYFGIRYTASDYDRVLRVGVECDYPPNNWEEGEASSSNFPLVNVEKHYAEGYDIQIAKLVASSIGAKLELKKIAWENLIPALNGNEIDAIFSGMLDTSERRKLIDFSDTYEYRQTEYAVLIHKDTEWSKAKKLTDFSGAKFVAQAGSNFDTAIEQLPGAVHLEPVKTVQEVFDKLNRNEADGTVSDLESINAYVKMYPNLVAIKFPKNETFKFDYTGVCAGVRKTDTKLIQEINTALKNISPKDRQRIMDRAISREWNNI